MTVEENILKKANQKRILGNMAIEGGNFTTDFFKEVMSTHLIFSHISFPCYPRRSRSLKNMNTFKLQTNGFVK